MNILRILRVYLIFILAITAMSLVSYSSTTKFYLSSVLTSVTQNSDAHQIVDRRGNAERLASIDQVIISANDESEQNYVRDGGGLLSFQILNSENNFVKAGEKGARIASLKMRTKDSEILLSGLKFNVSDADKIFDAVYLEAGAGFGKRRVIGKINGEQVVFAGLKYITQGTGEIVVRADVSENVSAGERFRFILNKSGDIEIFINGERYQVPGYYPLTGEFLTIIKSRETSAPVNSTTDIAEPPANEQF